MLHPLRSLLCLAIFAIATQPHTLFAKKLTPREVREFMGLYVMKSRTTVYVPGDVSVTTGTFELPVRWNGSGGDGVQEFPGGSYRPVAVRLTSRSNSVRIRQILAGSGFDKESAETYEVVGLTSLTLNRKANGRFTARANSRIAFGSFAYVVQNAFGRRVR